MTFSMLLIVLLVLGAVAVAAAAASARGRGGRPPLPSVNATSGELAALVQRKQDHFREERLRILQMVHAGRISDEEGDRLLATLERETLTRDCPLCGGTIHVAAVKCKHCQRFLVAPAGCTPRLTRSNDRMLAGVCGGIAAHMGIDPSLVRILAVLLVLATGFFPGLLAYLVMAMVLPPAERA
jgi:phage shock protein C